MLLNLWITALKKKKKASCRRCFVQLHWANTVLLLLLFSRETSNSCSSNSNLSHLDPYFVRGAILAQRLSGFFSLSPPELSDEAAALLHCFSSAILSSTIKHNPRGELEGELVNMILWIIFLLGEKNYTRLLYTTQTLSLYLAFILNEKDRLMI